MHLHIRQTLENIKHHAAQALHFKHGMDFVAFAADHKTVAACVFALHQLGRHIQQLDAYFINETAHVKWHHIVELLEIHVYEFDYSKLTPIWGILEAILPGLIEDIEELI